MLLEDVVERIKIFKTPEFIFEEERHIYTLKGNRLQSVTGWIGNFVKPFDTMKHAEKKAIEKGVSVDDILHGWKVLNDDSLDLGHLVHKYIEDFLSGLNPSMPDDELQSKRIKAWLEFYDQKLSKMTLIAQELRIWSEKYKMAGTIDALFWYKNKVVVGDWKTNKKFTTDKDKAWNKMLFPFENYNENKLNFYSLQTSTYQAILKENGITADHAFICWISPNATIEMHTALNFTKEIDNFINAFPSKKRLI
jgi:hypothetical protein